MLTTPPPRLETPDGTVPVRCFVAEALKPDEGAQLRRLAAVPGMTMHVAVLPDVHVKDRNPTPTGTVAATADVLLPRAIDGGVNCGLRTMVTAVPARELSPPLLDDLFSRLIAAIPLKRHERPLVSEADAERVLLHGLEPLVSTLELPPDELARTEGGGRAPQADPETIAAAIGPKAVRKGVSSLGTIGAGNHFLELQEIAEVLDGEAAAALRLEAGAAIFTLHSDSRRLGKKITRPLVEASEAALDGDGTAAGLWRVPVDSDLGRRWRGALAAATHAGYANRAAVTHVLRTTLRAVLGDPSLSLSLLFDTGHESIRPETHEGRRVWVHRHGASHARPPGTFDGDAVLGEVGQPVTVAGSMGTSSLLCVARPGAAATFNSVAHGAGRVIAKRSAAAIFDGEAVEAALRRRNIRLYRYHADEIAGQAPDSFKDVEQVVAAMAAWDLVRPVARLRPVAVLKG